MFNLAAHDFVKFKTNVKVSSTESGVIFGNVVYDSQRYTYIHTYIHTYMHTYIYIYTYIHTYIHIYIHTYIHTYIHAYIRTYIHACNAYIHNELSSVLVFCGCLLTFGLNECICTVARKRR